MADEKVLKAKPYMPEENRPGWPRTTTKTDRTAPLPNKNLESYFEPVHCENAVLEKMSNQPEPHFESL